MSPAVLSAASFNSPGGVVVSILGVCALFVIRVTMGRIVNWGFLLFNLFTLRKVYHNNKESLVSLASTNIPFVLAIVFSVFTTLFSPFSDSLLVLLGWLGMPLVALISESKIKAPYVAAAKSCLDYFRFLVEPYLASSISRINGFVSGPLSATSNGHSHLDEKPNNKANDGSEYDTSSQNPTTNY